MSEKILAIIGAGEGALPIIKKAKEMGVTTLAFARHDSIAKDLVDIFIEENSFDIDFIVRCCKKYNVNGVMPSSELTTEVAAKVAYLTGLPGNDVEKGFAGKNKYVMRTRIAQSKNVKQPWFSLYSDRKTYVFPVIVKSVDSCGKRGVGIAYDEYGMKEVLANAQEYSSDHTALIEEYLNGGQEYSIECLSYGKGKHQVIQYTEKESAGPPHFVEIAHHQPADLSEGIRAKIDNAVYDILELLGLYCGMAHIEIKIIDGVIYFIEVGARGGGDHISDILTPLSTGFDYYKSAIECHMGCYEYCPTGQKAYTGIYFHSKQNEMLRPLFEKAKKESWCIRNTVVKDEFDDAISNVDASRSGYFIYLSDHRITLKDCQV